MTTDEVVLRRDKAAANGTPYKSPPPRLRGQSTYLALLSSLATDLDIMLNDLRSSPSTRLLPNSHHLPTRSASNGSSPLTIGGTGSNNSSNSTENSNYFGYRRRALCSNYNVQQQTTRVQATTTTATTTTVKTTQCYRRGQNSNQNTTAAKLNTSNSTSHQKVTPQGNKTISSNRVAQQQSNKTQTPTTTATPNQKRQQVSRIRPDAQKLRARNASGSNSKSTNCESNGNVTKNLSNRIPTSVKSDAKSYGLSPEVKQIQKLPLWSYQQRQLEQPQKLHVQRLQQRQPQKQRATQSVIGGKTTDVVATTNTKLNHSKSVTKSTGNSSSCRDFVGCPKATNVGLKTKINSSQHQETQQRIKRNVESNAEYSDCKEDTLNWLNMTTDFFGLIPNEDTIWSSEHSSSHQTSNANVTLTAQNQSKTTSNIVTQHCNTTTTSATTISSTTSNSNNNNNNNNSNNNHRRLPFCGLDSIKGSDKNGIGSSGTSAGGTTNLSFDLNLQSEKLGNPSLGLNSATVDLTSEQFHSLDAPDSSIDGQFDDDMQALLPKCQRLSRDELSQSRTSLVSSSDGGILAEGETSSETSRGSDDSPPCDLGLVERLLLTHPVWFLPGIQRSGAVHFLQGKEEGNFIVRGSSQPNTMAVSVRLPPDTGPYIEHYLIQSNDGILSLESSRFKFDSIPALIAHYAQCCDELPVQLVLPRALREAKNRQQLSSLALLGQEFWRYPMSCPKSNELESTNILDPKSPNSLTETSGLGTTVFSSNAVAAPQSGKIFSPTGNLREVAGGTNNGLFSQAGTPSDTTSSMSSFTTSGGQHMQLMSPESVDSVILTMSPVDMSSQRNALVGLTSAASTESTSLSTFKAINGAASAPAPLRAANKQNLENGIRPQRPKPPNTLNLDLRKPPAPPLRWSKPISPHSPTELTGNNFTVTTTVTFSMDQNQNSTPQFVEVTTPAANNNILTPAINANTSTFQTFSKRLSPEGECKDTLSSQGSSSNGSRWQSQSSKDSNNSQRKILSPSSMAGTPTSAISGHGGHSGHGGKSRKSKARKESKHYQESDILESPQIYCRSTLIDKISDYEDLWSHDPSERAGLLTSFKPPTQPTDGVQGKRPDLLAETPTITSLNSNLLSPANSNYDSSSSPHALQDITTATPPAATATAENTADTHELIQFSGESQPRSRTGLLLSGVMSQSLSENQLKHLSSNGGETTEGDDTTPTALTPASRSKQGSPFYAEPADALRQAGLATASILRRSQRVALLPANHRHSEPPKGGIARTPMCPLLVPAEIEKIAGSLDELKKKQQQQKAQPQREQQSQQATKRPRGRFEQWQLDSSWEFMGKQDDGRNDEDEDDADYDSEAHWQSRQTSQDKENILQKEQQQQQQGQQLQKPKPVTVHQIIAKRLPDLNLPELVRCSTPPQQTQPLNGNKLTNGDGHNLLSNPKFVDTCSRLSSYDNVERNFSFCQSYFNGIDSAQSDDGTVFSEPWDSSQWDSFMPHDDTTITSDTIHLSKCRPAVSEDDTIIEELSTKDNSQDTLKAKKTNGRQKVATILRNPSMRDREVLCHPRNKISPYSNYAGPGDSVRAYTLQLAQDQCSTFARNIENFISCTKESREAAPQVVMRNMRQFMNGMKNYLVKHGEGKFQQEVDAARGRLKSDEFLNLDVILETVMHQLVVLPLREHLYGMFVDYYTRSEDIQLLAQNVKYACGRNAIDFGIRSSVTPPSPTSLTVISNLLLRLQEAELPLDKLDLFLCVISTIFDATGCPRGQQLGADDFLPILVYVVAKCGFVGAEIEAEFMWGLLQPTLLNGEPGYYLTALCSAVHVLKSFMASENESGSGSLDWRSSSLPACSSVLRVIIPDECNGSLQTRTLPVRPHTTTREVCRIIAHKARITNPQDYALFKLVDGEETLLSDIECPQDIRLAAKGKHCMLAYKRIDAKIAWPTATQPMHN